MKVLENLVGLPENQFGITHIHAGNLIYDELAKQNKGLKAQYNHSSNKISILNSH